MDAQCLLRSVKNLDPRIPNFHWQILHGWHNIYSWWAGPHGWHPSKKMPYPCQVRMNKNHGTIIHGVFTSSYWQLYHGIPRKIRYQPFGVDQYQDGALVTVDQHCGMIASVTFQQRATLPDQVPSGKENLENLKPAICVLCCPKGSHGFPKQHLCEFVPQDRTGLYYNY